MCGQFSWVHTESHLLFCPENKIEWKEPSSHPSFCRARYSCRIQFVPTVFHLLLLLSKSRLLTLNLQFLSRFVRTACQRVCMTCTRMRGSWVIGKQSQNVSEIYVIEHNARQANISVDGLTWSDIADHLPLENFCIPRHYLWSQFLPWIAPQDVLVEHLHPDWKAWNSEP